MTTQLQITNRLAAFAHRAAMLAILASLVACADNAEPTQLTAPVGANFGRNGNGPTQRLLFSSLRDGNQEVYSMNADGTSQTRLTNDAGTDAYGVWSPDGKRIAFYSTRDNPLGEIYTMSPDGTGIIRLTNSPGMSREPSWSKDGKQIVFMSNRTSGNPSALSIAEFEIYIMNADGSGVARITTNSAMDINPVWSPDGKQIAFISNRDNASLVNAADLYVMNVDGSQVKRLTNQSERAAFPSWDPHSKRIAFAITGGTRLDGIYVIEPATLSQTRLTFGGVGVDVHPSWSPDGAKIAFSSSRDGNFEIYSMNADGTQQTRLTNNTAMDWFVRWSR